MLWLLSSKARVSYDEMQAIVVRASDEEEARRVAQGNGEGEVRRWDGGTSFWINPGLTDCVPLNPDGPTEVIIRDVQWG